MRQPVLNLGPPDAPVQVRWSLSPGRIAAVLAILIGLLTAMSVAYQIARYGWGWAVSSGYVKAFDLDEGDVPAFFAGVTFLLCAGMLAAIAGAVQQGAGYSPRRWRGLAIFFLLMSVDRAAALHTLVPCNGFTLIVACWIAVAAVVLYVPWLWRLPAHIRLECLAACALFAAGAVGVQIAESHYAGAHGSASLIYGLLTDAEEVLELAGTVVFIHALLLHLQELQCQVLISVSAAARATRPARGV